VFILLFLSLLCHCFKVMICMYVCCMLFNKYSKYTVLRFLLGIVEANLLNYHRLVLRFCTLIVGLPKKSLASFVKCFVN